MTTELRGNHSGQGLKIGIVVARFNDNVTSRLLKGAKAALAAHGVEDGDIAIAQVPGSFEIPVAAKKMADSEKYDAVVCLGAVIKGDTDHYRYISEGAARGISSASIASGVPLIFGVLTTDTMDQALERAGGKDGRHVSQPRQSGKPRTAGDSAGNSGYSAGMAAIEMANLLREIDAH